MAVATDAAGGAATPILTAILIVSIFLAGCSGSKPLNLARARNSGGGADAVGRAAVRGCEISATEQKARSSVAVPASERVGDSEEIVSVRSAGCAR